jgi:hypothetical protein
MKFYRIFESAEQKEVGFVPQVINGIYDFDRNGPGSYTHLSYSKATEDTLWPKHKLYGRAKRTDLVSVVYFSSQLLVSDKLKDILANSACDGLQFIPTTLYTAKGKELEYWIINPYPVRKPVIDVAKTEFAYINIFDSNEIVPVTFNSIEEYTAAFEKNKKDAIAIGYPNHRALIIRKIEFLQTDLDFFNVPAIHQGYFGYFVSQALVDKITKSKCTGIVLKEANEKYP